MSDVRVTDNGPQFSSAEFAVFVKQKGITHVTSSPHYAQSNGKSKNAVKTLKLLFAKAKQSGESEYMALLDWRNTPSEGMSTSPAQRLMGRRCKTLLPTAGTLLKPRYDTDADTQALTGSDVSRFTKTKTRTSAYADRRRRNRSYEASGREEVDTRNVYRAGQLTKLSREHWRDGLQTQSTTVGVCWRGAPQ